MKILIYAYILEYERIIIIIIIITTVIVIVIVIIIVIVIVIVIVSAVGIASATGHVCTGAGGTGSDLPRAACASVVSDGLLCCGDRAAARLESPA